MMCNSFFIDVAIRGCCPKKNEKLKPSTINFIPNLKKHEYKTIHQKGVGLMEHNRADHI